MTGGSGQRVVLVAAVARNGVIGDGPRIPWRVPGEQAHFKAVTLGHVLLMGRTTSSRRWPWPPASPGT